MQEALLSPLATWHTFYGIIGTAAATLTGLLLGLAGLGGVTYVIIVFRRARGQTDYEPVLEDWLWHTVFPLISYAALVVAAFLLPVYPAPALFVIAAATVLLLFIGIHNAWDNVTYIAIELSQPENTRQDQ
jgi:hypothetical protein